VLVHGAETLAAAGRRGLAGGVSPSHALGLGSPDDVSGVALPESVGREWGSWNRGDSPGLRVSLGLASDPTDAGVSPGDLQHNERNKQPCCSLEAVAYSSYCNMVEWFWWD